MYHLSVPVQMSCIKGGRGALSYGTCAQFHLYFCKIKKMFKSKGDNCWHCSRLPLYVPVDICCSFVVQVKDTLVSDMFNFRIMSDRRLHVFLLCYVLVSIESCSMSSFCCWKFIILICVFIFMILNN